MIRLLIIIYHKTFWKNSFWEKQFRPIELLDHRAIISLQTWHFLSLDWMSLLRSLRLSLERRSIKIQTRSLTRKWSIEYFLSFVFEDKLLSEMAKHAILSRTSCLHQFLLKIGRHQLLNRNKQSNRKKKTTWWSQRCWWNTKTKWYIRVDILEGN